MQIGVAYYPEHWPEQRWAEDARLIRKTGIEVVRVGEFAWSHLEPRRGRYEMDWLERAIEVLDSEELRVILCTPTAAPPSWLFDRHPTMLPEDREGRKWYAGSRRHVCLNNRPYRRYVLRIVRELARDFGHKPQLYAWQIDNELGCHGSGRCYCDDCEQAFREWLKRRYGTIERLNNLWGTAFWSQEFLDWHYIPAPRRTPAGVHPSLALDYERFMSATVRDFVKEQREIIEENSGGTKPITTNSLGLGTEQVNQFSVGSVVDVASYDNYPVAAENADAVAMQLDLTRAMKRRSFWVLEQQAGPTLIPAARRLPESGQLRLWSFQAAARGAELISYFRWRTCAAGQEMHWYGLLDAGGTRRRRYRELQATIEELKEKAHLWEGLLPEVRVALMLDYDCMWALQADSMGAELDYRAHFQSLYSLFRRKGVNLDIVPYDRELDEYALVVAPMQIIARGRMGARWHRFVEEGGTLVVTAPAGYRTEHNSWFMSPPPGPFASVFGVEVTEHDIIGEDGQNHVLMDGEQFPVQGLACLLEPDSAEALAEYGDGFYAGTPAVTRRSVGEGSAYFVGAVTGEDLYDRLLQMALDEVGIEPHPWASQTVEVVPLNVPPDRPPLTFVLNHGGEDLDLDAPEEAALRDLLTDEEFSGRVPLAGYGVRLLEG